VALELARYGRTETVCTLSPGGFWLAGDGLSKIGIAGRTD